MPVKKKKSDVQPCQSYRNQYRLRRWWNHDVPMIDSDRCEAAWPWGLPRSAYTTTNTACARPANTALTGPTAVLEFTVRKTFRVIARIEYMGVFNSYKQALGVRHYGKKPNSMLMGMWVLTDLKVYTREPEGHLAFVQQVDLYPYGTVGRRGEMETHARNIAEEFADEYAKAVVDDITRTD